MVGVFFPQRSKISWVMLMFFQGWCWLPNQAAAGRAWAFWSYLEMSSKRSRKFLKKQWEVSRNLCQIFPQFESRWEHLGLPSSPSHNWQLWRLEDRPNGKLESFNVFFFEVNPYADQILNWQAKNALPGSFISSCNSFPFPFSPPAGSQDFVRLTFFLPSVLPCVRPSVCTSVLPSPNRKLQMAVPTEIWRSRLRSGSAHWDLKLGCKGTICVQKVQAWISQE